MLLGVWKACPAFARYDWTCIADQSCIVTISFPDANQQTSIEQVISQTIPEFLHDEAALWT